jgi:hypothetical protein
MRESKQNGGDIAIDRLDEELSVLSREWNAHIVLQFMQKARVSQDEKFCAALRNLNDISEEKEEKKKLDLKNTIGVAAVADLRLFGQDRRPKVTGSPKSMPLRRSKGYIAHGLRQPGPLVVLLNSASCRGWETASSKHPDNEHGQSDAGGKCSIRGTLRWNGSARSTRSTLCSRNQTPSFCCAPAGAEILTFTTSRESLKRQKEALIVHVQGAMGGLWAVRASLRLRVR